MEPTESRLVVLGYRALTKAIAGDTRTARQTVAQMEELHVDERQLLNEDLPQAGQVATAKGALALAEERYAEASSHLAEASRQNYGVLLPHQRFLLAQALELSGETQRAIAQYDTLARTLRVPIYAFPLHGPILPLAHERLGELYEQAGDRERAVYHYGKFVSLWERADPELQPRVAAARRALARLTSETGSPVR
ncbi:MAG: hypothetical protein HY702_02925 [Gemmatimonadetes bacterium]|nr:hypothetical protein [Gemmatimonadota bacterium]